MTATVARTVVNLKTPNQENWKQVAMHSKKITLEELQSCITLTLHLRVSTCLSLRSNKVFIGSKCNEINVTTNV